MFLLLNNWHCCTHKLLNSWDSKKIYKKKIVTWLSHCNFKSKIKIKEVRRAQISSWGEIWKFQNLSYDVKITSQHDIQKLKKTSRKEEDWRWLVRGQLTDKFVCVMILTLQLFDRWRVATWISFHKVAT